METLFLQYEKSSLGKQNIETAGKILKDGGLVAFPTETVYGLGGDALNPDSSKRIYAAKGRPSDNPLIVHIADLDSLPKIVSHIPKEATLLAKRFWPGPLTMILNKSEAVPLETTGGLSTVAVRMPKHDAALELIRAAGGFVAAPSANTSGRPSPTNGQDVAEDMNGRIDAILDGGEVGIGIESTIVDLTVSPPQILRPGYITKEMLDDVLGQVEQDITMFEVHPGVAPKAPGMKYRHYAPKGELTIVRGNPGAVVAYINQEADIASAQGVTTGVIATEETKALYTCDVVLCAGKREDEGAIARHLYSALREFDRQGAMLLFSESFETPGLGMAVMNRLLKAAGHRIIDVTEEKGGYENDSNRK